MDRTLGWDSRGLWEMWLIDRAGNKVKQGLEVSLELASHSTSCKVIKLFYLHVCQLQYCLWV